MMDRREFLKKILLGGATVAAGTILIPQIPKILLPPEIIKEPKIIIDMAANAYKYQSMAYDPVLVSLIRRCMPQLIAYDICGVQPMTAPSGLIFSLKSKWHEPHEAAVRITENIYNRVNKDYNGKGSSTWSERVIAARQRGIFLD
jgi:hypothetical protein